MKTLQYNTPRLLVAILAIIASQLFATQVLAGSVLIDGPGNVSPGEDFDVTVTVDGGPAQCTITGISTDYIFDVGVGYTENTQTVNESNIPKESGSVKLDISCVVTGGGEDAGETFSDTVVVIPAPSVSMFLDSGETTVTNETDGNIRLRVNWDAENAEDCSFVSWTEIGSGDSGTYSLHWHRNRLPGNSGVQTSGYATIYLYETTELSMTCYNRSQGVETTEYFTISVEDPVSLGEPYINILKPTSNPETYNLSPDQTIVRPRIQMKSFNSETCWDLEATNVDMPGEPHQTSNWVAASYHSTEIRRDVIIATSTVLSATCGYADKSVSTTTEVTIILQEGAGEPPPADGYYYDGTGPSVIFNVNPNPVTKTTDGSAYASIEFVSLGADTCQLRAYETTDGITLGNSYNLSNWTRTAWWNQLYAGSDLVSELNTTLTLSTSTILQSTCTNYAQATFGATQEIRDAAVHVTQHYIEVEPSPVMVQRPDVWVYAGPSVRKDMYKSNGSGSESTEQYRLTTLSADDRVVMTNIKEQGNIPSWPSIGARPNYVPQADGSILNPMGSVTFTFDSQEENIERGYNVHVRHCDEGDGDSTWRILTDREGLVGTYTSDKTISGVSGLNACNSQTITSALMASDVRLQDGDRVTVECTVDNRGVSSAWGESCYFTDIYLGTGSGSDIEYTTPEGEEVQNQVMWFSDHATRCDDLVAEQPGGFTYDWSFSTAVAGSVTRAPLNATTTYSVTCENIDGQTETEDTTLILKSVSDEPVVPPEEFTATYELNLGQCWEKIPVASDTADDAADGWRWAEIAPAGHVRAPSGLETSSDSVERADQCIPLVDLALENTQFIYGDSNPPDIDATDGVDNVNGRYSLTVRPFLRNTANYALPADSNLYYKLALDQLGAVVEETVTPIEYTNGLAANSTPGTESIDDWTLPTQVSFGTYNLFAGINHTVVSPSHPVQYPEGTIQPDDTVTGGYADNEDNFTLTLPVPEPPIMVTMPNGDPLINNTLGVNPPPPVVRAGTPVVLDWSVNVNYDMTCTASGPGFSEPITISPNNTNSGGLSPATGSLPEVTLQSTAQFQLSCTADAASGGSPFEYVATIQVTPNDISEI